MKKLLLVSYYFPPHLVPESLLSGRTVKSLTRSLWNVTVLTNLEKVPGIKGDDFFRRSIPETLSIIRIGGYEHIFNRCLISKTLYRILGFSSFLPEIEFLWIPAAIRAGRQLWKRNDFDIIHSWACCHASNVVGLALKKLTGLPWVAHFSDPWIDNPFYSPNFLKKYLIRRLEKAVIQNADLVVFTTQLTIDVVMKKYPESWSQKVVAIPHGYDADFIDIALCKRSLSNKIRFVYTGAFYGERNPEAILQALYLLRQRQSAAFSNIEVIFVGQADQKYVGMSNLLNLSSCVNFTGQVSFSESLEYAAGADVLLVIDAPNKSGSMFLPSKLVDYLMFNKPIFGITPEIGASADLLRELDCPIADPLNIASISDILENLFVRWQTGNLQVSNKFKITTKRYHIDETTKTLQACFNSCITANMSKNKRAR